MNNDIFNKDRFSKLLLRQIQLSSKGLLIAAAAYIGFSVFIMFMPMIDSNYHFNASVFFGALLPMLFLGGLIATSMAFAELNSPQKSYLYLTLPASTTEKLTVAWLSNSILYLVFTFVILFIINLLLVFIDKIGFSRGVYFVNLFDNNALIAYANYLVIQPIFLLGAIYFRRMNFLKTVLALIAIGFAIALYSGLLTGLAVWINGGNHLFGKIDHYKITNNDSVIHFIAANAKILYWGFVAPFFLLVSYFSLKERQV